MELPKKGITGIYKITNPKGRVYIGQSKCIRERWQGYKSSLAKYQKRLHYSFKKYSIEKHKFEVIHVCEIDELNRLERYYQDFYDVLSKNGLNLTLQDADDLPRIVSEETRKLMSLQRRGRKMSDKAKENMKKNHCSKKEGYVHNRTNSKPSEETKRKIGNAHRGRWVGLKKSTAKCIVLINRVTNEVKYMGKRETALFFNSHRDAINRCLDYKRFFEDLLGDWDIYRKGEENKIKPYFFKSKGEQLILDTYTGIYYYGYEDLGRDVGFNGDYIRYNINKKGSYINQRYILTND